MECSHCGSQSAKRSILPDGSFLCHACGNVVALFLSPREEMEAGLRPKLTLIKGDDEV